MPEEDRHEVDRSAIQGIFGTAAEVKLEGRVIPVVRTRAAGISQEASIAAKIAVWARLTEAKAEPLLACLEALQTHAPEEIAATIMERDRGAGCDSCGRRVRYRRLGRDDRGRSRAAATRRSNLTRKKRERHSREALMAAREALQKLRRRICAA
jgi:hypothetical protein